MKKFFKEWKLIMAVGLGVLLLGLALRLINLTILPVFADEAIYIRWSQIMGAESTLRFLPLSDGKQPLFMWILMFVVKGFANPLVAGRVLSVAAGMGSLVGIFALGWVLFKNKSAALAGSLIWAISPYSVFFDRMALVDALLTCFGVWTAFLGVMVAKTLRLDMAMLAGFALGASALTKSSAIFFALLLPTTWLMAQWPKSIKGKALQLTKLIGLFAVTGLIAAAMYNIQRLGPNFHLLTARTLDYVFPLSHLWENPKDPFIFHYHRSLEWIWIMGPWPVFGLAAVGFFSNLKKHWRQSLMLLAWWLVPSLIQAEFAKVYTARYELFTIPFLYAVAGTVFLVKGRMVKMVGGLLIGLFVVLALRFDYFLLTNPEKVALPSGERSGYLEEWTAGTGISEVADYIKAEQMRNPEGKIVVGTEGYFGTLPDGLQMYLQGVLNVTVIGVGLGFSEVPVQLTEAVAAGSRAYLVANSSRLNFPKAFEEYGLRVVASYKKADRLRQDTHEFIWYGSHDTFYLFEVVGK